MSALEDQFVAEARELIRQATDNLIALERDGKSPERIDNVFRAFHTLKGSAGVVELPAMSVVLHAAEDLLDSVRHGSLGAGAEIVDAALACLDQVSRWVDSFEAAGALPSRAGEDSRAMAQWRAASGLRTRSSEGRWSRAIARMGLTADCGGAGCDYVADAGGANGGHGYFI